MALLVQCCPTILAIKKSAGVALEVNLRDLHNIQLHKQEYQTQRKHSRRTTKTFAKIHT